jgi:trehalose 6-phosphate synthase/phosphatase
MVREKLPDARIGFFLHSAFPSSEIFRCLAKRKELLDGMLGANLIAFQTDEYAQHFLQTCSRLLTVETTAEGVQLEDHFVNVTSQPIGINPPAIQEARQTKEVQDWVRDIQKKYEGKMLIVARDKLDNVHGVRQNLLAFERFLKKYPKWVGKVVLIQVATSTAEQSDLLSKVSDICNRIDNIHSSLVSQSLVFLKQDIDFPQYLALLMIADVLMISALRDGMNLQAHEFIFCQDGKGSSKKHGPLILSEFTGSAAVFHDHIPINPWHSQGQADAINKALTMSAAERERRWTNMNAVVMSQTGGRWALELEKSLAKVHEEHRQQESTSVPRLSVTQVSEKYRTARHRVIFLDYEGTLAPHKTRKGIPLTSPNRVVDTLNDLMTDSKNIVYIMSGRRVSELDSVFRTATGVGLIAENGCFIREYGVGPDDWKSPVNMAEVREWMEDIEAILNYYHVRMEGSRIEEGLCSVLLRYDNVEDQETAIRQAGECADHINAACESYRIQAVPVHKAVLVQMKDYSKGTAATKIYKRLLAKTTANNMEAPDFMMVVGDDREDEVVFRWANGLAAEGTLENVFTVSVGKRNTEARAALTQGSSGLLGVLQKLAKISLEMPMDYFNSPRVHANMVAEAEAETA